MVSSSSAAAAHCFGCGGVACGVWLLGGVVGAYTHHLSCSVCLLAPADLCLPPLLNAPAASPRASRAAAVVTRVSCGVV